MDTAITRILGIAPYEGLRSAMEKAAQGFAGVELTSFTGDLKEGVEIVRQQDLEDFDAIISRGGTAEMIRQVTDIPVISVPLSVYDILRVIKMVEGYFDHFAIVGFPGITGPAHTLCDLLQYDLDIKTVHSAEEAELTLNQLKASGVRTVVCDMITHTIAQKIGLSAFLITSGMESLQSAFEEALSLSSYFRQMRKENLFLRRIAQEKEGTTVILDQKGEICYSTQETPDPTQIQLLKKRIKEIPFGSQLKFYENENGNLYQVTASAPKIGQERYYMFHYSMGKIPLRSDRPGIRTLSALDVSHLVTTSFYKVSGALGEIEGQLNAIADTFQPILLVGEPGTAKEQIARAIYLRSTRIKAPFVTIDCAAANDKSWDYLFNHYMSPLNDKDNTVYFRYIDALPPQHFAELLAAISDSNVTKRVRLIFSCDCESNKPLPEAVRILSSRIGSMTLQIPTLRSRMDEIPALAGLYLNILNRDLGKQLVGFEPKAIDQLRNYDWPNNYTQFKQVLSELAALSSSPYIKGGAVADILSRERTLYRPKLQTQNGQLPVSGRTLEEISQDAVRLVLEENGGNQTAAAKALGISRTTLWRYLSRE